jgi:hypothetical protein
LKQDARGRTDGGFSSFGPVGELLEVVGANQLALFCKTSATVFL